MSEKADEPDADAAALWRLYGYAVDEYRFQVNLNWQRLQYFLGLNVAVLGIGAGLLRIGSADDPPPDNTMPALIFVAGVALSLASWYLARRQHGYYRSARERMVRIARLLGVEDLGVATTAGSRGEKAPAWMKVRAVTEAILAALAVLNGIGAVYAVTR